MKHLRTYEDLDNIRLHLLKDYFIMNHGNKENRMVIMKLIRIYKGDHEGEYVDKVETERVYLFDLLTGKDITVYCRNWHYSFEFLVNNILYQSDNVQDLLDIKDEIVAQKKYNL